jgi:hypothetical protein
MISHFELAFAYRKLISAARPDFLLDSGWNGAFWALFGAFWALFAAFWGLFGP